MSAYENHQTLIEPARPSAGVPRLVMGLIALIVATSALNYALVDMLRGLEIAPELLPELSRGNTPRSVFITLLSFLAPAAALWVVIRLVHKRSLRGLIGPRRAVFRDFFRVLRATFMLVAVYFLVPMPAELRPEFNLAFSEWLPLLPFALGAIFIQITTEELIFRGYLQSQLAARFKHPVIWLFLPSVLFGLSHLAPETYGPNAWLIAVWATGFGVVAADLTARAGNLGPAMALHFVNNVSAILLMGMMDYWDGIALLHVNYGPGDHDILRAALLIEVPLMLCFWLAARIAIRR